MLRDLLDAAVHCQVIMPGCNEKVDRLYQSVLVDRVMVEKCPARRFGNSNALESVGVGNSTDMFVEDVRLVQNLFNSFDAVQDLHETRVMLVEGAQYHTSPKRSKLGPFGVRLSRTTAINDVQSCQRTHSIHAFGISGGLKEGRFQIRKRLDSLRQVVLIFRRFHPIQNDVTRCIHKSQDSVIMFDKGIVAPRLVRCDEPHKQTRKISENADLIPELFKYSLEPR